MGHGRLSAAIDRDLDGFGQSHRQTDEVRRAVVVRQIQGADVPTEMWFRRGLDPWVESRLLGLDGSHQIRQTLLRVGEVHARLWVDVERIIDTGVAAGPSIVLMTDDRPGVVHVPGDRMP